LELSKGGSARMGIFTQSVRRFSQCPASIIISVWERVRSQKRDTGGVIFLPYIFCLRILAGLVAGGIEAPLDVSMFNFSVK
jgi:hypothetical protein